MELKKNKYYFIEPEFDLHYRSLRLLLIINKYSLNTKGNKLLTLEKIMLFDFLVANPTVFQKLLEFYNIELQLRYVEQNVIENFSYNSYLLTEKEYRLLLNILISNGFIELEVKNNQIFYSITNNGVQFLEDIDNNSMERLLELIGFLEKIKSKNINELKNLLRIGRDY